MVVAGTGSKMMEHVFESERAYMRNLGVRTDKDAMATPDGFARHRDAVCRAIREYNERGEPARKWPLRYFIRRATWHVLDHAWEMEDKDLSGQERRTALSDALRQVTSTSGDGAHRLPCDLELLVRRDDEDPPPRTPAC